MHHSTCLFLLCFCVFNMLEGGHMTVYAGLMTVCLDSGICIIYKLPFLFSSWPVCTFACFNFPYMDVRNDQYHYFSNIL